MAAVCVYKTSICVCMFIYVIFSSSAFKFISQVEPVGGASLKLCWHSFLPRVIALFLTLPASGLILQYITPHVCDLSPPLVCALTWSWPSLFLYFVQCFSKFMLVFPFPSLVPLSPFKFSSEFYHLQELSLVPLQFAPHLCFCFRFCQVSGCLFYMSAFPVWTNSLSAGLFTK